MFLFLKLPQIEWEAEELGLRDGLQVLGRTAAAQTVLTLRPD